MFIWCQPHIRYHVLPPSWSLYLDEDQVLPEDAQSGQLKWPKKGVWRERQKKACPKRRCEKDLEFHLKLQRLGPPAVAQGVGISHCLCSGSGRCCSSDLIPGPGTTSPPPAPKTNHKDLREYVQYSKNHEGWAEGKSLSEESRNAATA